MYLRYGNWISQQSECEVTIRRTTLFNNETRQAYGFVERWDITGFVQHDTAAGLSNLLLERKNAFSVMGGGLALLFDDGSVTNHVLISTACFGGTRVVEMPSFPNRHPAEYASASSHRVWTAAVEGEIRDTSYNYILAYRESISYEGTGGPISRFLPVQVGPWIKQTVHTNSTWRAVQEGEIVAAYGYLPANPPLWPLDMHHERAGIRKVAPKKIGNGQQIAYTEWTTQWRWEFENAFAPFVSDPIPQQG